MAVFWYDWWTGPHGYNAQEIFVMYEKLELIYDPERWSPNYHTQVDKSVLKYIYRRVQPRLVLQEHLPQAVRMTTEREGCQQLRIWLQIANHVKEQHTLGLR